MWRSLNRDERFALATFVMFLCHNPIEAVVSAVFSVAHLPGAGVFAVLVVFLPLAVSLIERYKKGLAAIHIGFPAIFCFWVLFFLFTLTIHPEYAEKMFQEGWRYNIVDSFFYPLSGIYAFGVMVACRRPKVVLYGLYLAALVLFFYDLTRFANARIRGYWDAVGMSGASFKASYSLGFGYDMLLPTLVFLAYAFKGSQGKVNAVLAFAGVAMILLAGNRTPLTILAVATIVFWAYCSYCKGAKASKVLIQILLFALVALFFLAFYDQILGFIASSMESVGLSSRSINAMINGSFSEANGRDTIYGKALELIEQGSFFGYGLYGDRYYLGPTVYWGYPHNILYELQITFGAVPGTLILLAVIAVVVVAFVKEKEQSARLVILILLLQSLSLCVSLSYLTSISFWALLGFCYLLHLDTNQRLYHHGGRVGKR